MRIHAYPDPNPGQTLPSQKVKFLHEKYTLNGVCREKFGVSRVYAKVRYGSGTVVLEILYFIYSASIVKNIHFRFRSL